MRSLFAAVLTASVLGPLAGSAFAADLDYPYGPPPVYERHPVPPMFIPGRAPPMLYRAPVIYPRPLVRAYPRPYPYYGPRPLARAYPEPRDYAERGYDLRDARPDAEPGFRRGDAQDAYGDRHDREGYGRASERADERGDREHYGHYLNHDELDHRAERERGYQPDDRYADRERSPRDLDR